MNINGLGLSNYPTIVNYPKTQKEDKESYVASNPSTYYEPPKNTIIKDFNTYLVAKGFDFSEICPRKKLNKDDYQQLLRKNVALWQISPDAVDDTTALILSGHIKDIKDVKDASTLARIMLDEANQTNVSYLRRNLLQRAIKLLPNGRCNHVIYSEDLSKEILKSSLALTKNPADKETITVSWALEDSEKNNNPYYKEWANSGLINYYTYIKIKEISSENEIKMMDDPSISKARKQQFIYQKLLSAALQEENKQEKEYLMEMAINNLKIAKMGFNNSDKSVPNVTSENINPSTVSSLYDDKIIKQKQDKLEEIFKIKDASVGMWPRVEDVRLSTFVKNFEENIISTNDGQLLNKKNEILAVIEKTKNISQQEIEEDAKKIDHNACKAQLYFGETLRKEFLENLYQTVKNDPSNDNVNIKSHIESVQKDLEKKHSAEFLKECAKSKLELKNDNEINIEKIELTKEDIDLLKRYIEHHEVSKDNYNLKDLSDMIISEYVGGNYNMKNLPSHIVTACLQTQKRYNSEERSFNPTSKEPVYRWLSISDMPDFIKKFPEVGKEYSYPKMQSCSKYEEYAENEFRDDSPDMLVKFVIHPVANTSQAYDIGYRKYGNNEVIYPPNTKFKVLAKEFVETEKQNEKYGTASPTFYRYVIHLLEVAPKNEFK